MFNISRLFNGRKMRNGAMQALPFWIASLITGIVAVLYTRSFEWAEHLGIKACKHYNWLIFVITPFSFLGAWLLVKRVDVYARGSGIPQVMAAIELTKPGDDRYVKQLLNLRLLFVKVLSSLLMIFGGGAIGREGPTIQIAGIIFRKIDEWLPPWWPKVSRNNMILTGAAAGLAAAFNTPLGGIVFAVEELARSHISSFKTAIFTAVIIAGLTAQAFLGPYLYLGYPVIGHFAPYMLLTVIPVALVAGLSGSGMGLVILKVLDWKDGLQNKKAEALYVLGCALLVATIAYSFSTNILGSGKSEMTNLLFTHQKQVAWQVPASRIVGPVLSFTTGASGGIFAPSLAAGATIGSFVA
ncbi:MAG TPA: chloride channel protein, partial [Mucilaginibacter sp.]